MIGYENNMLLSIIVPVYNEEKTISQVLLRLINLKLSFSKEIIVVDDGSTDGTKKRMKSLEFSLPAGKAGIKNLRVISHKYNKGKGEAVKTGIASAKGDYILIQDADLEYNPSEIPRLIKPILNDKYKRSRAFVIRAIYGTRFKNKQAIIPLLYLLGNKLLTFITNILYGVKLTDMETGYKLLPAVFMKSIKLTSSRFDIEPEITAKLIKAGIKIVEVPISYKGRSHLAGKKLTIRDAFAAIKILFRLKFS